MLALYSDTDGDLEVILMELHLIAQRIVQNPKLRSTMLHSLRSGGIFFMPPSLFTKKYFLPYVSFCSSSSNDSTEDMVAQIRMHIKKNPSQLITALDHNAQVNLMKVLHENRIDELIFKRADADNDGTLSKKEFEKMMQARNIPALTVRQCVLVSIRTSLPMIGFGFMDNLIMICAGDWIDNQFGRFLGISTLAAAGLGNLVSDLAGLGVGNYIESSCTKLGIPSPHITQEQMKLPQHKRLVSLFNVLGISIGCILGMIPLLFMKTAEEKRRLEKLRRVFNAIDVSNTGSININDLKVFFSEKRGFNLTDDQISDFLAKHTLAKDKQIHFDDFVAFEKEISQLTAYK